MEKNKKLQEFEILHMHRASSDDMEKNPAVRLRMAAKDQKRVPQSDSQQIFSGMEEKDGQGSRRKIIEKELF